MEKLMKESSQQQVKWLKVRCVKCGIEYEYPKGGYKPSTCGNFECLHKHLHPEINKGRR